MLARVVAGFGHDAIAREICVKEVGAVMAREDPDVGLGSSSEHEHALDVIAQFVREAWCPGIAILHAGDPAFIPEAAERGVFAYVIDTTPEELKGGIEITCDGCRVPQPAGRVRRRALIEQARQPAPPRSEVAGRS